MDFSLRQELSPLRGHTLLVPWRDISPKSARERSSNYAKSALRIWGRAHRKSRRRVIRGGDETRLTTGTIFTDKLFTGQREMAGLGIYHYNARFYSPKLGRFLSADTIVPGDANPQAYNRYSYVTNNPLRYTDPTGHMQTDGGDGGLGVAGYTYVVEKKFGWELKDKWSRDEVKTIYQTGNDILAYVDGLTGGMGQEWMNAYLGGTTIEHRSGENNQTWPSWAPGIEQNTIYLVKGGYNEHWFAHELGHIWDINTGDPSLLGVVNGVADLLNTFVGGKVSGTGQPRFFNYPGKPADSYIPSTSMFGGTQLKVRFDLDVSNGYGNGSTADYLAESFAWNVYDSQKVPLLASNWVHVMIAVQAQQLP